ncbi:MAG: SHOCT domain-containing protein [Ktedonobacteraceae bacterium]|nr:SHOCT domain-containing protein [Ktedonobacteraceae bacterium]MBO0795868.1 SHOCT domain-containing protein [Ktedonobacteraceae bacterium]
MHWGIGFWPLFPLFWIAMIVFFCWLVRSGFRGWRRPWYGPEQQPGGPSALEILRQRYARGEIDGATFDQMRERLEGSGDPLRY